MTVRKPKRPEVAADLVPYFSYRVTSPMVMGVLGLGPSQILEAIRRGELPPPMNLTASGRSKAYTGQQLIDIQRERIARAVAAASEPCDVRKHLRRKQQRSGPQQ